MPELPDYTLLVGKRQQEYGRQLNAYLEATRVRAGSNTTLTETECGTAVNANVPGATGGGGGMSVDDLDTIELDVCVDGEVETHTFYIEPEE